MLRLKIFAKLAAATSLTALVGMSANAQDRISDFSLVDADGRFFQLSRNAHKNAIVLLAYDMESRDARRAAGDLEDLAEQFADQQVDFLVINSTGLADKTVMREEAEDEDISLRILMDDTQLVAEELGLTRAAEVAIIDPQASAVVYRGALSNRHADGSRSERNAGSYAEEALTAILAGGEISSETLASTGDALDFTAKTAFLESVTYADDVAPILEQRCSACHQEGGVAPFAMESHQMIQGWSPMIRESLMTKRMPPGQIDNEYVQAFHDINHITVEETQKLVHWIDTGARNEGSTDPLAALDISPAKWLNGEPDMIIDIPPQQIPATGVLEYRNLVVPLDIDEDVWVKAVEFEAGDPAVLHHIIAFSYGPDGINQFEILNQGIGLGAYAPGNELNLYPENAGFPLEAGGGLLLQMHYTVSGKETVDASQIGLYLWEEEPEKVVLGGSAADMDIDVPPFSTKEMVATKTFREDVYLSMLGPHMHFRGYDANFKLRYPDGRVEEVLNIPNYQFNWQKVYDFKEPMFLPAGTELVFRGTFDNTEYNPNNPDPSVTLNWGEQTWQEMFFGFFRYTEADSGE